MEEGTTKGGGTLQRRGSEGGFTLCATFVLHRETSEALGWREAGGEREDGKDEGKSIPWQA